MYSAFSSEGHTVRWSPWDDDQSEEVTTIEWENEAWTITGAVGREDVQYVLRVSPTWHVRQFLLFRDMEEPDLWLGTDGNGRWGEINGAHRPDLDGCVDIDLICTPFTNTLPIRRLPLHVGDAAEITVAYVDVDKLEVVPHHQRYTRIESHRWRYEALDSGWTQEFDVDEFGLVIDYPTLFRRVG
ncbi:MAG TPA: putative glycolipid-binding domain-containing protein [Ilumatobacteraceae bacterium]